MAVQARRTAVTVELTIEVPRDDRGTLTESATAILASVDAVDAVEEIGLAGVTPGLNGVTVDATAELVVAVEADSDAAGADADAVRRALDERFGVSVDRVEA